MGDYAAAVAAFSAAIDLEPGNADFFHVRLLCMLCMLCTLRQRARAA
jgi:hypothetical protein